MILSVMLLVSFLKTFFQINLLLNVGKLRYSFVPVKKTTRFSMTNIHFFTSYLGFISFSIVVSGIQLAQMFSVGGPFSSYGAGPLYILCGCHP